MNYAQKLRNHSFPHSGACHGRLTFDSNKLYQQGGFQFTVQKHGKRIRSPTESLLMIAESARTRYSERWSRNLEQKSAEIRESSTKKLQVFLENLIVEIKSLSDPVFLIRKKSRTRYLLRMYHLFLCMCSNLHSSIIKHMYGVNKHFSFGFITNAFSSPDPYQKSTVTESGHVLFSVWWSIWWVLIPSREWSPVHEMLKRAKKEISNVFITDVCGISVH